MAQYSAATMEKRRAYSRRWHELHKDDIKERKNRNSRKYYASHKRERDAYRRRWSLRNKDKEALYNKRWWVKYLGRNRLKARVSQQKRRQHGLISEATIIFIVTRNRGANSSLSCVLCGGVVDDGDWTIEHKLPLSRGGSHAVDNLDIAHGGCNAAKQNKTMQEWFASEGYRIRKGTHTKAEVPDLQRQGAPDRYVADASEWARAKGRAK